MYPGTFDPFTNGHLDIAERAAAVFDEIIIAVATDNRKNPLFSIEERVEMAREACRHLPNVCVEPYSGLTVDFALRAGVACLVKGIRAVTDFEYEMQMAMMNRSLSPGLDTVIMVTDARYAFLSSGLIKEVCSLGGDVSAYVPATVLPQLVARLQLGRD